MERVRAAFEEADGKKTTRTREHHPNRPRGSGWRAARAEVLQWFLCDWLPRHAHDIRELRIAPAGHNDAHFLGADPSSRYSFRLPGSFYPDTQSPYCHLSFEEEEDAADELLSDHTRTFLEAFRHMSWLESISLTYTGIPNAHVARWGNAKRLVVNYVHDSADDDMLRACCGDALRDVTIRSTAPLSRVGVDSLARCPNLRSFTYIVNNAHGASPPRWYVGERHDADHFTRADRAHLARVLSATGADVRTNDYALADMLGFKSVVKIYSVDRFLLPGGVPRSRAVNWNRYVARQANGGGPASSVGEARTIRVFAYKRGFHENKGEWVNACSEYIVNRGDSDEEAMCQTLENNERHESVEEFVEQLERERPPKVCVSFNDGGDSCAAIIERVQSIRCMHVYGEAPFASRSFVAALAASRTLEVLHLMRAAITTDGDARGMRTVLAENQSLVAIKGSVEIAPQYLPIVADAIERRNYILTRMDAVVREPIDSATYRSREWASHAIRIHDALERNAWLARDAADLVVSTDRLDFRRDRAVLRGVLCLASSKNVTRHRAAIAAAIYDKVTKTRVKDQSEDAKKVASSRADADALANKLLIYATLHVLQLNDVTRLWPLQREFEGAPSLAQLNEQCLFEIFRYIKAGDIA